MTIYHRYSLQSRLVILDGLGLFEFEKFFLICLVKGHFRIETFIGMIDESGFVDTWLEATCILG
jgi:hypothetical protein